MRPGPVVLTRRSPRHRLMGPLQGRCPWRIDTHPPEVLAPAGEGSGEAGVFHSEARLRPTRASQQLLENGTVDAKSQCGRPRARASLETGGVLAIPSPPRLSGPGGRLSDLHSVRSPPGRVLISMESLILAQDERWRRASYMQVEREVRSLLRVESGERVSNT